MTIRIPRNALFTGVMSAAILFAAAASAQDSVAPADAQAATQGQPERYSLVAIDGDILRVDRQNGTVSVCREQNQAWRCRPVPLAEDAYLAEISELAGEVDRLTARLEQLESAGPKTDGKLPPGSALDRPGADKDSSDHPSLMDEEEEDLEKVLTFTESAMRRFFGMVRELQKDFEGDEN
ncbi:hypothetical protein WNZ15_18575 [Roseibium sp. AS2]|uniref:hypothetical protein n=1 Tax=Roseibium sp. AS2 TaxID=3135781 RepID=UPI003171B021